MKVAFVTTVYAPNGVGGAERTVQTLAEALVAQGHEACVISLSPEGSESEGELNGVRTFYLPLANLHWPFEPDHGRLKRALWHAIDAYNPLMGARVGRILKRERPDVLQTGNLLGFSVAVWRAADSLGVPVVQMLHDYYLGCPNSSMFRNGRNCASQCTVCRTYTAPRRALSGTPAAVISLSHRTLDRLEGCGLFPGEAETVVIHGASQLKIHALKSRPLRSADALTLGYLGRIAPNKGIEFMLDAVLRVEGPRVRVLLGGSGEASYLADLQARYASPAVQFCAFVKPEEFFERIDVLVVPSLWEEPLGRVIYEAYAHGVPSIVTRMGGMPEIVEEGVTGFVIEPGDVPGLARRVQQLAQDWRGTAFVEPCLAKSQEFRIDHVFERYLGVWQRAAASATASAAV